MTPDTRALESWYHEKESAWLYARVAAAEPDPIKHELFLKLAVAAEEAMAPGGTVATLTDRPVEPTFLADRPC